jgi:predicted ATP-grasp superfamily ATP-dependent carboligase
MAPTTRPYVIILANGLNGLGAVRSAAYAGLKTYTLLTHQTDLTAYSRYSQYRFLLPPDPFVEDIRPILDQLHRNEGGPGVLLACSDSAAELLAKLKREGYSNQHLIVPTTETTDVLNDKRLECHYMEQGGITLPKTYYNLAEDTPKNFPLIIKPRTFREYKVLGAKNVIIDSPSELEEFNQRFYAHLDRFIAQEVIEGSDDNLWVCNVTFDQNQRLSACFVFKRLGTMPSHYGVTSMAISQDNQALREECAKIGKALNYTGPAMIEFKRDQHADIYYYIETNPRLGMCNWFDTRCGINNILACTHAAYGNRVEFAPQKNNIVYWNFFGDLIARLEDREHLLAILFRYMAMLRRRRIGALLYWKDPQPALRYGRAAIRDITQRVGRKLRDKFG